MQSFKRNKKRVVHLATLHNVYYIYRHSPEIYIKLQYKFDVLIHSMYFFKLK